MTHQERVLRTFRFEQTDRIPYDLMEGIVWQELLDYFQKEHGLGDGNQVLDFLDTDFRWVWITYQPPKSPTEQATKPVEKQATDEKPNIVYSKPVAQGPLANARTIADIEAYKMPEPSFWQPGDFVEARRKWQDHALVYVGANH